MKMITLLLIGLLLIPFALAGTVKIYPTADAYTDSSKANTNLNNDDLKSGYDLNHGKHRTYLKFDLSVLEGKNILGANLSMRAISPQGNPTINLYYVPTDSWGETSLTWNNAPAYPTFVESKTISVSGRTNYTVLSLIDESDNILSLALVSTQESSGNVYVQFYSKDHPSESERPYIEVTYEGDEECNTVADTNCDGQVSLTEYNTFKYNFKSGLLPGVTLTEYNTIKYNFKSGLLN